MLVTEFDMLSGSFVGLGLRVMTVLQQASEAAWVRRATLLHTVFGQRTFLGMGRSGMTSKRAVAQLLQMLQATGVSHIPRVTPPARRAPAAAKAGTAAKPGRPHQASQKTAAVSGASPPRSRLLAAQGSPLQPPKPNPEVAQLLQVSSDSRGDREQALCALQGIVAQCSRCEVLAGRRTQTVFGVGNPEAKIMFVGEAPGREEDEQGEPFVGPAGQLLNRIITASKLRREDIYICNILRCRPPGNRNPLPQEAANCREFLQAQIDIVRPEYIVCWGGVAAHNLLNVQTPVSRMRKEFFEYGPAKVLVTYHPSYLLRNADAKKLVWEDMQFLMRELGLSPD